MKILNGSTPKNKDWTVTNRQKKSKRKKHYVDRDKYARYLVEKRNKINKINPS